MTQAGVNTSLMADSEVVKKLKSLTSGLTAGLISRSVVAPFERTIIIKQTSLSEYSSQMGMFQMLRKMFQNEGLRGLFRGNAANCLRVAPTTAIEFFMYDVFRTNLTGLGFLSENIRYVLSGSLAGVMAYTATYPIDMVKTMHSLGLYRDQSVMETLRTLVVQNGFLKGIFPYAGLKLASYQVLTNLFYKNEHTKRTNNTMNFLLGGLAGMFAVTISYPTDFLRRNYQILKGEKITYGSIVTSTYKKKGLQGFYQGLGPTYFKIIPSTAIAFLINDYLKNKLLH